MYADNQAWQRAAANSSLLCQRIHRAPSLNCQPIRELARRDSLATVSIHLDIGLADVIVGVLDVGVKSKRLAKQLWQCDRLMLEERPWVEHTDALTDSAQKKKASDARY